MNVIQCPKCHESLREKQAEILNQDHYPLFDLRCLLCKAVFRVHHKEFRRININPFSPVKVTIP